MLEDKKTTTEFSFSMTVVVSEVPHRVKNDKVSQSGVAWNVTEGCLSLCRLLPFVLKLIQSSGLWMYVLSCYFVFSRVDVTKRKVFWLQPFLWNMDVQCKVVFDDLLIL